MTAGHANISVFVPHIGCPNMCSFCNQRYITGAFKAPLKSDVVNAVETAVKSSRYDPHNTEIAFFGGSFTAINRNYMTELLKTAYTYVKNGTVRGIRISTRPDAIDDEIISILRSYGVTSIELGAQSMSDRVLKMNNRGHSVEDVVRSSEMIKQAGFELGLQMMTGLYGDTDELALKTAETIIKLSPDTVRIYPTIVLKGTDLAALYSDNKYQPQTLEDAVSLCTVLYKKFTDNGIRVIRLGLHSIENEAYIAGPWHPAFSELCQSQIMLEKALETLAEKGKYIIYVSSGSVSKMVGQKRKNINTLKAKGYDCRVKADTDLKDFEIRVEKEV